MTWRLNLFASESYLERFGIPKKIEDLDQHRLLIFGDIPKLYPDNYTSWPLTIGTNKGKMRKPFLIINSIEGMFNLVRNGVGIGNFAQNSPLFEKEKLVPIFPDEIFKNIDVYYIYLKEFDGIDVIKTFETFLKKYIAKN